MLRDVNCDFYKGQIHLIAGPSGSGKSTLLQVLNGLIPHVNIGEFEGRVLLYGEDITDKGAIQRSAEIGLVMQDPEGQFCTFTVGEELAFGLENHSADPEEIGRIIKEELHNIGLDNYEDRNLQEMSGGQKQKIAIASIMAMRPEVLLLDEPTANLDPINRKEILELLLKLAEEQNKCIIMVEHNLEDIIEDVDKLLILDEDGSVAAEGERDEVIRKISDGELDRIKRYLPRCLWDSEPVSSVWGKRSQEKADILISIRNLNYAYPVKNGLFKKTYGKHVLSDLCLEINTGDFMVIAGENGAGKSTLLNAVFCVSLQQSGEILLENKDVRKWARKDLYNKMGLVFQNPELQFITNQVDEELLYSLKQTDLTDEEKVQKVHDMLERFHLDEYAKCSPFILSQGQKRRLSVATMLLTEQRVLFLDEPTYGQDSENKEELMSDMLELNRHGVTVVFITHDEDLIRKYAKRVVYLEDGKFVLDGSAEDYFSYVERKRRVCKC